MKKCRECLKRQKRLERTEEELLRARIQIEDRDRMIRTMAVYAESEADKLITSLPGHFVQCGNCWKTLLTKIPAGVTGDFYCNPKCHEDAKGENKTTASA